jgi:ABC-type Na+ transport system ATPase subunit NatA
VILRLREARFLARGAPVGPISLAVAEGERVARTFAQAREASIVALMAAGIVKASAGSVLVDEYDPRVQPVHCKRTVAFVPHDPLPLDTPGFERYIRYRAALWGIDPEPAWVHARLLLERLEGVHEAFAYPLAGALISNPKLLVLDRPQPAHAERILAAAGARAIFSTHTAEGAAHRFGAAARAAGFGTSRVGVVPA